MKKRMKGDPLEFLVDMNPIIEVRTVLAKSLNH